jgi:hypothetical protein
MKDRADENLFESVEQALGTLEWVLVQSVFNVRARTAAALRQYLDHAGIEIPESVIQSRKWFGAFHRAPSIANHKDGFGGLLRDRLFELGFEENAVWDAIEGLEQDLLELCLDVQSAVARELCADLEAIGLHVPPSILHSKGWRDVFTREQRKLPAGAASIVKDGIDTSVFRAVVESSASAFTQSYKATSNSHTE